MKPYYFISIVMLGIQVAAMPIYAENVMVYVEHRGVRVQTEIYRTAIEAGIIDTMFETGNVAFNMLQQDELRIDPNNDRHLWIRSTALNSGADYVLWVVLNADELQGIINADIDYGFVEIYSPGSLVEGKITETLSPRSETIRAKQLFDIGTLIAYDALAQW